ncbi:hypothetical protein PIB30_071002 [Stylosanthes scabra]|uniref:Uncharacterized protein n=1 Tax=Stylosanthes scabra TaxID=79078 RepID=A0ABU6QPT6_9FABA|nr:hypothetical protein [Stylosanthes scabra]
MLMHQRSYWQSRKHYASAHQSRKHSASQAAKERQDILQDDDGLVEDDSDSDQGIGSGLFDVVLDALDLGANPDESDSWHSEELKTSPNSEDEKSDGDSDDFPVSTEGTRFGNIELRVGMKFLTKHHFREAVRKNEERKLAEQETKFRSKFEEEHHAYVWKRTHMHATQRPIHA